VASRPPRPLVDGYIFPADPIKTAYYLIKQAGGVKQARVAITAAARLDKRRGGRPREINDEFWLRIAANLQHRAKTQAEAGKSLAYWEIMKTKEGAIEELAGRRFSGDAAGEIKTFTRRLLRKLGKRPLSDFITDFLDVDFPPRTKPRR
jgi:hypothetical protein